MSRETDALVAVHRASGIGGHVTSITSNAPGRATGTYHQRVATPSSSDKKGKGLAADFGDDTGDTPTDTKLAIFNLFAKDSSKLAELFYSHASFFVKNGKRYPIAELDRGVFKIHKNHVHVAVAKGTFLTPVVVSPRPAPVAISAATSEEDDDMIYREVAHIEWPDGGHTQVFPDGLSGVHGTNAKPKPFFGDMGNLPAHRKLSFKFAIDIVPVDINDPELGYIIIAQNHDRYKFDRDLYENHIVPNRW